MSNRSSRLRSTTLAAISVIGLVMGLGVAEPSRAHADAPAPRVGLGIAGGEMFGTVDGFYGGLQARLGVQWSEGFATYVQSQGLVGTISGDGDSASVVGALLDTFMFEATIGESLQLGVGPSLDYVWACRDSQRANFCASAGPYFGLDARFALHLTIFTMSLDVHPMWLTDDAVATWVTLGLGVDF